MRDGGDCEAAEHFLADQVMPRLLAHIGGFVIHAGAVRIGDGAAMIVGDSGLGKSTLVASLDRAGYKLIGDDALIIRPAPSGARVASVYRSLRLRPDSIAALFDRAPPSSAIADYTTKRRLDVDVEVGIERADPLIAIFFLGPPSPAVNVTPRAQSGSCVGLIANSFALDPTDLDRARSKLSGAAALAAQVPAFTLSYPRDYARLPEVRAAMLDTMKAITA